MKLFLQGLLLLSFTIQGQVKSQVNDNSGNRSLASVKTISIYSSDNSFFEDYPIDSLVEHLNLVNKNPGIVYCKNSGDNSKTGFAANYLVNLKLSKNEYEFVLPRVKEVAVSRPTMNVIQEAGGSIRQEISEQRIGYTTAIEYIINPKVYYLSAQAFRKKPYKKFRLAQWDAKGDVSEKAAMIIKLINYLQEIANTKE